MRSLIICSVGNPITFSDQFNSQEHWRYVNDKRNYDTYVVSYNKNFIPESNSYDKIFFESGQKWELMKKILPTIDYSQYEYIGFFDDDLITDIDSINGALEIANEIGVKAFQLSLTPDSDVWHRSVLGNKSNVKYAITTFVEVMGPFFHSSLIPLALEFWNEYDIKSGWGFDMVLKTIAKTDLAVIHKYKMFHPKKESSYDKNAARAEMYYVFYEVCPRFMRKKYGENWKFHGEDVRILKMFEEKNDYIPRYTFLKE